MKVYHRETTAWSHENLYDQWEALCEQVLTKPERDSRIVTYHQTQDDQGNPIYMMQLDVILPEDEMPTPEELIRRVELFHNLQLGELELKLTLLPTMFNYSNN